MKKNIILAAYPVSCYRFINTIFRLSKWFGKVPTEIKTRICHTGRLSMGKTKRKVGRFTSSVKVLRKTKFTKMELLTCCFDKVPEGYHSRFIPPPN